MQRLFAVLLLALATVATANAQEVSKPQSKPEPKVAVISADLGDCSADVTVVNSKYKPVANARVSTQIHYGFAGLRRLDLEIYTNIDGKARVEGLPEAERKPLSFDVTFQGRQSAFVVDTANQCKGTYTAVLTDKARPNPDEEDDSD